MTKLKTISMNLNYTNQRNKEVKTLLLEQSLAIHKGVLITKGSYKIKIKTLTQYSILLNIA